MIQNKLLNNSFNGKKIEEARKIRNLTLDDVAGEVGLSHQAISKYEKNKAVPGIEVIDKLAQILRFEPSFFYLTEIDQTVFDNSFIYRSKASVAKKYKDQTESQIALIDQLIKNIKSKVKLPPFDISLAKTVRPDNFQFTDDQEIEEIASEVRKRFGLSDGPIGNLMALCEKLGIHVLLLNLNHQGIDACSVMIDNVPYIVLNKDVGSSVRMRFTLAHELGHILLHSLYSKKVLAKTEYSKRMEYEANRLGSAILLPESGLAKDLSSVGLDYLLILKRHWLVSVQLIIYRAEQLELFTSEYSLYLRQQISRKQWRINEPYDDSIPYEQPKMLTHALNYLNEKLNVSVSELSFQTGIPIDEIFELCMHDKPSLQNPETHLRSNIKRIK